jgi:Flp pilus assembly pilin Flp
MASVGPRFLNKGATTMKNFFRGLVRDEEGAAMVEYALMVALISAVLIVAVPLLTAAVKTTFTTVAGNMTGS